MAPVATPVQTPAQQAIPEDLKKSRQSTANLSKTALDRVWRGNKEGTVRLHGRPDFKGDKYAERQWIKEHMAAAFRFWGKCGYAEGAAGHITVRDPVKPGHYWMNPVCVAYSSIKASDLVLVDPEGYVTEDGAQLPINAAGFYIHTAIHKARPDIEAAAHCHSIHARTWSVFGKPIELLTQDSCVFYQNLSVYKSFGGIVLASEEGERIAKAIGPTNKAVLLQNHGSLTLGTTVDEAVHLFTVLENACRVQLMAEAAAANGVQKVTIDEEDAAFSAATQHDPDVSYIGFMPEYNLLVEETNGAFLK
ncbi:class II aldolase/adducin N-terminal [Gautieria morchelliformis]|nr:class II aldolase/adducin N-terminal [Gautieria morchelliformis]